METSADMRSKADEELNYVLHALLSRNVQGGVDILSPRQPGCCHAVRHTLLAIAGSEDVSHDRQVAKVCCEHQTRPSLVILLVQNIRRCGLQDETADVGVPMLLVTVKGTILKSNTHD